MIKSRTNFIFCIRKVVCAWAVRVYIFLSFWKLSLQFKCSSTIYHKFSIHCCRWVVLTWTKGIRMWLNVSWRLPKSWSSRGGISFVLFSFSSIGTRAGHKVISLVNTISLTKSKASTVIFSYLQNILHLVRSSLFNVFCDMINRSRWVTCLFKNDQFIPESERCASLWVDWWAKVQMTHMRNFLVGSFVLLWAIVRIFKFYRMFELNFTKKGTSLAV